VWWPFFLLSLPSPSALLLTRLYHGSGRPPSLPVASHSRMSGGREGAFSRVLWSSLAQELRTHRGPPRLSLSARGRTRRPASSPAWPRPPSQPGVGGGERATQPGESEPHPPHTLARLLRHGYAELSGNRVGENDEAVALRRALLVSADLQAWRRERRSARGVSVSSCSCSTVRQAAVPARPPQRRTPRTALSAGCRSYRTRGRQRRREPSFRRGSQARRSALLSTAVMESTDESVSRGKRKWSK